MHLCSFVGSKEYNYFCTITIVMEYKTETEHAEYFFYPNGQGEMIAFSQPQDDFVPHTPVSTTLVSSPSREGGDWATTAFLTSVAFVGIFMLFQLSNKRH